jgi:hypothetical protein
VITEVVVRVPSGTEAEMLRVLDDYARFLSPPPDRAGMPAATKKAPVAG